jgi:hypothetical protein
MRPTPPRSFFVFAALLTLLTLYLGYEADRTHFSAYIGAYGAFFALYAWVCFAQTPFAAQHLYYLGIALRVLLLFGLPNLSDDYIRFLWDGRLTAAGYHPFLHPPDYFINQSVAVPGITQELYQQLNSPHYYTVYPPVSQAIFAIVAWVASYQLWASTFLLKLLLFAGELGVLQLLRRHAGHSLVAPNAVVWYALNPLVILEITGNCHFEGLMVYFLLAGLLALQRKQMGAAAIHWALAVATKMLPLLFLPMLLRWLGWRQAGRFLGWFVVASLVLFAPLLAVLPNIAQSLDLYFREFQFNASVYYLVREVGYAKIGWDIGEFSGPRLAAVSAAGVLLLSLFVGRQGKVPEHRLPTFMLFALLLYMSCAAVVQPWYVCVPLGISLCTRWRFVAIWSGLVALSYSHYDGGLRQEHFGLIAMEYGVLWGYLLWEVTRKKAGLEQIPRDVVPE